MKKMFAVMLALVLTFAAFSAFAAKIEPLPNVNMAESLDDRTLYVGFKMENVSDTAIIADIYDEQRYDTVDVHELAVGDVIVYLGEEITVNTIEDDYALEINGGVHEENGITLLADEGGTYLAYNENTPVYMFLGCAELILADQVNFRHWQWESEGVLSEDYSEVTVPAAGLKALLAEEGEDELHPESIAVCVEGGKVTEVTIDYVP